jgi:hypothetical protein
LLSVSFQRFALPADGIIRQIPSSLGALAVGKDASGNLFLPVAAHEAFWIGLSTAHPQPVYVALQMSFADGTSVDALSGQGWREAAAHLIRMESRASVAGIRLPDGPSGVFARVATPRFPASSSVLLALSRDGKEVVASAGVALVDYGSFEALTGLPAPLPLDADAGYKGWRLP